MEHRPTVGAPFSFPLEHVAYQINDPCSGFFQKNDITGQDDPSHATQNRRKLLLQSVRQGLDSLLKSGWQRPVSLKLTLQAWWERVALCQSRRQIAVVPVSRKPFTDQPLLFRSE